MLNKKFLGMAVVAAMASNVAYAVVDMDDAADTGISVAVDSLLTTAVTPVGTDTYYNVTEGAADLSLLAEIGVGVSDANQIFVRYDLTEAALSTPVVVGDLIYVDAANAGVVTTVDKAVAQGGAVGDTFVIVSITAVGAEGIAQDDTLQLDFTDLALSGTATAGATLAVYETLTAAVNQAGALSSAAQSPYISLASGIALTVNTDTATADVETEFTLFTGSSTEEQIADIQLAAATSVFSQGGGAVAVADVVTVATSVLTVTGDFSVGAWTLNSQADCAGADTALTLNAGLTQATLTDISPFNATQLWLCNDLGATPTTLVPESTYTYGIAYTTVTNAAFPASDPSGAFGEIVHNGTTIQVPYMTTFSDYNQRLVIVNRGSQSRAYNIGFTPEAGVTATAGAAASGTLDANETTVIKVSDIVTITGGTRTAGTLTIVSPASAIDAATTQVNLSTGGTDTVYLD